MDADPSSQRSRSDQFFPKYLVSVSLSDLLKSERKAYFDHLRHIIYFSFQPLIDIPPGKESTFLPPSEINPKWRGSLPARVIEFGEALRLLAYRPFMSIRYFSSYLFNKNETGVQESKLWELIHRAEEGKGSTGFSDQDEEHLQSGFALFPNFFRDRLIAPFATRSFPYGFIWLILTISLPLYIRRNQLWLTPELNWYLLTGCIVGLPGLITDLGARSAREYRLPRTLAFTLGLAVFCVSFGSGPTRLLLGTWVLLTSIIGLNYLGTLLMLFLLIAGLFFIHIGELEILTYFLEQVLRPEHANLAIKLWFAILIADFGMFLTTGLLFRFLLSYLFSLPFIMLALTGVSAKHGSEMLWLIWARKHWRSVVHSLEERPYTSDAVKENARETGHAMYLLR